MCPSAEDANFFMLIYGRFSIVLYVVIVLLESALLEYLDLVYWGRGLGSASNSRIDYFTVSLTLVRFGLDEFVINTIEYVYFHEFH